MENIKNRLLESIELLKKQADSHPNLFYFGLLLLLSLLFLFFGIGNYPLIDVDESRYAIIARDMFASGNINCLMLNGIPFLEKPPLYFWLVGASCNIFQSFTPFFVRLPIAFCTMLLVLATYFLGKKVISRKFGFISSVVLLSSIFFLILSHIAILDMPLTIFVTLTLYLGFLTHIVEDKNKKYIWFLFYIISALAILTKGILGIAIPVAIMFVFNLITKTLKEPFKPINFIPGLLAMLLIITPWHTLMYKIYGYQFWHDYFLAHHFARFINSETIGRERPLLYFIPVFLLGFLPWSFIFIAFLTDGFKKLKNRFTNTQGKLWAKSKSLVETNNNEQKLILFASVSFILIFTLFSISSTKLPTYILPVFPMAAILTGYYLYKNDEKKENNELLSKLTIVFATIFLFAAIAAFVVYFFLPSELQTKLSEIKDILVFGIIIISTIMIYLAKTKNVIAIFAGHVLFMAFVIILAVTKIFNFVYSTGQNELVDYAIHSARFNNTQLITFDFAVKPSVMIDAKNVVFITDPEFNKLDNHLQYKAGRTFVIIKNKNFENDEKYLEKIQDRLEKVIEGERYSLYENRE